MCFSRASERSANTGAGGGGGQVGGGQGGDGGGGAGVHCEQVITSPRSSYRFQSALLARAEAQEQVAALEVPGVQA
jgi:hypothetical protein